MKNKLKLALAKVFWFLVYLGMAITILFESGFATSASIMLCFYLIDRLESLVKEIAKLVVLLVAGLVHRHCDDLRALPVVLVIMIFWPMALIASVMALVGNAKCNLIKKIFGDGRWTRCSPGWDDEEDEVVEEEKPRVNRPRCVD